MAAAASPRVRADQQTRGHPHTLFTANPAAIKAPADETNQLNPCHVAAMMKTPGMEIIGSDDPDFGSLVDRDSNTPLHLAARYSDSAAMVRELAQLHPAALEMKNGDGDTPLHLAARYSDSVAMVLELAQLHPAKLKNQKWRWRHSPPPGRKMVEQCRGVSRIGCCQSCCASDDER
jgi:ankyrin repeat protein